MSYIKGKVRQLIYEGANGYKVGLFRVKETDSEDLAEYVNKTITFTGYFSELNKEDNYTLEGKYTEHERYGYQYVAHAYQRVEPEGIDALIEFLASPLIKGCSEKTAKKIVDTLGEDALIKIKENKDNLLLVEGMTEKKCTSIYNSLIKYNETDDLIIELKSLGFSMSDCLILINTYSVHIRTIIESDFYSLVEVIPFNKLDSIYIKNNNPNSDTRIKACIIQSMKTLAEDKGDTYHSKTEIYSKLKRTFHFILEEVEFDSFLTTLIDEEKIITFDEKIFLIDYYIMEDNIANTLNIINNQKQIKIKDFSAKLKKSATIRYNKEQMEAIKTSLENSITIITGGPGTGKTTIIQAIVKLYMQEHKLTNIDAFTNIALLAPTGRAVRRMGDATKMDAGTIHRYLKWNKDTNEFQMNEDNKHYHKLIIIDEMSMIDTYLFDALLKGIDHHVKLVLIGDTNQLPSVGAGNILDDLINADKFAFCPLERIYRQSKNSYIPDLCREIKNHDLSDEFSKGKDDYNFIEVKSDNVKKTIENICHISLTKNLSVNDIQVLAPMYKGENGIDNLNLILQNLFNPKDDKKTEIKLGYEQFREGDKVIQLVNDVDNGVFNGDIGYIESIIHNKSLLEVIINFDGNKITYKRKDLHNIKHAYAISIHKSQGSEFDNIIMPITKEYRRMLYNKLIYTGVSRAKKSLVIIGNKEAFIYATENDYSELRKTNLKAKILAYLK